MKSTKVIKESIKWLNKWKCMNVKNVNTNTILESKDLNINERNKAKHKGKLKYILGQEMKWKQ